MTAGLGTFLLVALPSIASASIGQHGDPHPLGIVNVLLIFLGVPLLVTVVLAAIFLRPRKSSGSSKYRAGRAWDFEPTWFGTEAPVAEIAGGGSGAGAGPVASPGRGGASGSW